MTHRWSHSRRPFKAMMAGVICLWLAAWPPTALGAPGDCVPVALTDVTAWWPGEGGAFDLVQGHHGQVSGGVTIVPAKTGRGFLFNGTDGAIHFPEPGLPWPGSGGGEAAFSFELWFQTSTHGIILARTVAAGGTIPGIYVGTDGKLRAQMSGVDTPAPLTTAQAVNDGMFHHLCVTHDGTTEKLFLDGFLADSATRATDDGTSSCILGHGQGGAWPAAAPGDFAFAGVLDEITLFNRALGDPEIAAIHQAGTAGKCQPQRLGNRTFTLRADFDQGSSYNLDANSTPDSILLRPTNVLRPFVNVACSSRGTIVRIDVNNGRILGEYLTAPEGRGRNPSRTTVDQAGNVWVANRNESGWLADEAKGSLARVALVIGGTRGNKQEDGGFEPDPDGAYLQPPFEYSTAVDRDGDGLIKTSRGLGDILPWDNEGDADSAGGVSTAEDECIINYTRVAGSGTRTVAVDANNDVWVGGIDDLDHEKIDGTTGLPVPGSRFNLGCGGYGGLIDGNGILWSARTGGGLLRYDTKTLTGVCLGNSMGDYGLAIDPQTGHIWHTSDSSSMVGEIDPAGRLVKKSYHGHPHAQGVAVDRSGNVWVAHSIIGSATTVGRLRTDGTYVGKVSLPDGLGPTGVAVDVNGKVWVTNMYSDNVMRIDPAAGPLGGGGHPVGAVDMVVDLGNGAGPYNYSDMTGFVALGSTAAAGFWEVVHDSQVSRTPWQSVSWNATVPEGTAMEVAVRAADAPEDLANRKFRSVANGVSLCSAGINGRHVEIRVAFSREVNVLESPVLHDLTVQANNTAVPGSLRVREPVAPPAEDAGFALVTVDRGCGDAGVVSVDYATLDGTAAAGEDFSATAGTLVFLEGEVSKTIEVPLMDDTLFEDIETLQLTLSNPTGGAIVTSPGVFSIDLASDDPPVTAGVSDVYLTEGKSGSNTVAFPIFLSAAAGRPVTVRYETVDYTATVTNGDYTAVSGTVTFQPGETLKHVEVPVAGDSVPEPDEIFLLNLVPPSEADIGVSQAVCVIVNDDSSDQVPELAIRDLFVRDSGYNGVIDPGETLELTLRLANTGLVSATGVTATLSTSAAGVTILQGSIPFADVQVAGSAAASAPFHIAVAVDVPCGATIDFTLAVSSAEGVSSLPLRLIVGELRGLVDEVESGVANWTHAAAIGPDTWAVTAHALARSKFHVWTSQGVAAYSDQRLTLHATTIPPGSHQQLRFWHTFAFEQSFDGAVIEISTDGGATFSDLGFHIIEGGYNGQIRSSADNPLASRPAWTGGEHEPLTEVVVDLSGFAGQAVVIRWRVGTDPSIARPGWIVDDVTLVADVGCSFIPPDTDGDGMPDIFELCHGFRIDHADDAAEDADGDGKTNQQEYVAGTNPRDSASRFEVRSIDAAPGGVVIRFPSVTGKSYRIESSADLIDPQGWQVRIERIEGTGQMIEWIDPDSPTPPRRFYRVSVIENQPNP